MYNKFVQISNVNKFMNGMKAVEARGAAEACMMLVVGPPGFGKSNTGMWWATKNDAIFIRVKAACTAHWILADLARSLGLSPQRGNEKVFEQVFQEMTRAPRPVVVDEIEHAVGSHLEALETLRDLSDAIEFPLVFLGRETVKPRLRAQRQIWSRLSSVAEFAAVTVEDVHLCAKELCEVEVAGDLVERVLADAEGRIRQVVKALATIERIAKRGNLSKVTAEHAKGHVLTEDWQRQRAA